MNRTLRNLLFGGRSTGSLVGDAGTAILRLVAGLSMSLTHGLGKLYQDGQIGLPEQLVGGVEKMGFPAPTFFAWSAALAEFLGAFFVALGLFTRPAAFFAASTMAVAAFVVHAQDEFATKEMAVLYLAIFVMFMLKGSGRFSIDSLLRGDAKAAKGFDPVR
ncbi:MAG: DoxX family protein [Tepidisphaeraceae bacterium]